LFREPHRFSFFQAVRLLEGAARRDAANPRYAARAPVGEDAEPQAEAVRFRTAQNLVFQANEISDLKPGEAAADGRRPAGPPTLTVTFMGLTGPSGVLPYHYTETVIRNLRARSFSLRDFLDLLNHRAIALFHRAWQKYRLVPSYERQPPG